MSIDSQRRDLQKLAIDRELIIIEEYSDVVESAKSEYRPAFQQLLRDLKSPKRQWNTVLMIDTSRLSRRRYVAQAFKWECKKRGIDILYSKVPEVDSITAVILDSVFEAMDEVHSLMSKDKGLAGMAENVRKGFRAGGRAPTGYKLKKIQTGAIREGEAVTKSVLEINEDAHMIGRYLSLRAKGEGRDRIKEKLGFTMANSSLIDIEWNALTYAGHTVWNVRNEKQPEGGYKNGTKRKPRHEWMINKNTHKALITEDEAESILVKLESSAMGKKVSEAKTGNSGYLLTGILKTPNGDLWHGNGYKHYRTKPPKGIKGRWVSMEMVDQSVIEMLSKDLQSSEFAKSLAQNARKVAATQIEDPTKELRKEVVALTAGVSKSMDMALLLEDPAPALRKADELERKKKAIQEEIKRLEKEYSGQVMLANITEKDVRKMLDGFFGDLAQTPKESWKELIRSMVKEITLDPESLDCQISYVFDLSDRINMASPRGSDCYPALRLVRLLKIA